MKREGLIEKIEATKAEMKTAGPLHRKDLERHMKRLNRELRACDRDTKSMSGMFAEAMQNGRA